MMPISTSGGVGQNTTKGDILLQLPIMTLLSALTQTKLVPTDFEVRRSERQVGWQAGNKDLIKANELANPRGFKKIESAIKSAIDP